MIRIRKAEERGHADHGWLDTYYSFSFASYYDPEHLGFRCLRALNEDRLAPGAGFEPHLHRDVEILTYVLHGTLYHRDNLGHVALLGAGEVQLLSAGSGIENSEQNYSRDEPVCFLQAWIEPDQKNQPPAYREKLVGVDMIQGRMVLAVSRDGREGSLPIRQDVELYLGRLEPGDALIHGLRQTRQAWVQVAEGEISLQGRPLKAGDGAAVIQEISLNLMAKQPSQVLIFNF